MRRLRAGEDKPPIKKAREDEDERQKLFGERVWEWLKPPKETEEKQPWRPDKWSAEKRDLHLYFHRYGLYERASTKMTHILKQLYESLEEGGEPISVPKPVAGAHAFWESYSAEPKAGWHTWEPGVDSHRSMEYMAQPFHDIDPNSNLDKLYVCGEAYSNEQGWIEGALKSVEWVMDRLGLVLSDKIRNHVGLEAPKSDPLPDLRVPVLMREVVELERRVTDLEKGSQPLPASSADGGSKKD